MFIKKLQYRIRNRIRNPIRILIIIKNIIMRFIISPIYIEMDEFRNQLDQQFGL